MAPLPHAPTATTIDPVRFDRAEGTPQLVVISGPRPGLKFGLTRPVSTIGKSPDADFQLVAHGVSRMHAKVLLVQGDGRLAVNIVDLGSTNGTFVNRSRVDMSLVREHDTIGLGPSVHLTLGRTTTMHAADPSEALTPRQLEIARFVAAGARNAEIARSLGVTPRTIASHLERSYRTLGLGSRAELTRWIMERGLEDESV